MVQVTGFKDYARLSVQAGDQLDTSTFTASVGYTSPLLDTTGYASLLISVIDHTVNDSILIEASWYADKAGTVLVFRNKISPTSQFSQTFQVMTVARYVRIAFLLTNGPGTGQATVYTFGSNAEFINPTKTNDAKPLIYAQVTVGAGLGTTQLAKVTFSGPATWHVSTDGTLQWYALLRYWDNDSLVFNQFVVMFGASNSQGQTLNVTLPPTPVEIIAVNQSAANAIFTMSLTV